MQFEEAVRKSIEAYFNGEDASNFLEAGGSTKYTREYFDSMEEDILGKDAGKKKNKSAVEKESLDGED